MTIYGRPPHDGEDGEDGLEAEIFDLIPDAHPPLLPMVRIKPREEPLESPLACLCASVVFGLAHHPHTHGVSQGFE